MKLLGFLLDSAYYADISSEAIEPGATYEQVFDHYKQYGEAACIPPNEYLADHKELLHDDAGKCVVPNWSKQEISEEHRPIIKEYIEYLNSRRQLLPKIGVALYWHAAQDPASIENLLNTTLVNSSVIHIVVLKVLEQYPKHVIGEQTVRFCLNNIQTKSPSSAPFTVFSNYITAYAHSSPHAVSLIEAISKIDCTEKKFADAATCLKTAEQFATAVEAGRKFSPGVFEQFGLWIEDLHKKNFTKLDGWILKFLAHGFMHRAYQPTEAIVEQLQRLLPTIGSLEMPGRSQAQQDKERGKIRDAALAAITFGLEHVTDLFMTQIQTADQVSASFNFISSTVDFLVQNDQVLSLSVLDSIIDFCIKANSYQLPFLTKLVENSMQVPGITWSRLIEPLKVLQTKSGVDKQALDFLFYLLSAHNIDVPATNHRNAQQSSAEFKFDIEELLFNAGQVNSELDEVINEVEELIDNYKIPSTWHDRYGRDISQILDALPPAEWYKAIWNLYRDNKFFVAYPREQLLAEFAKVNERQSGIEELRDYLEAQFAKIAEVESRSFYKVSLEFDKEPTAVKRKTIHVFIDGNQIFYKLRASDGSIKKLPLIGLAPTEQIKLQEILRNKSTDMPCLDLDYINRATGLGSDWQREDFVRWSKSIKKVDDNNIDEVVAVLKQVMHLAGFKGRFFVRDAQTLALLGLFHSETGRLAQVGTGEGKTEIIAMFAALKVLQGRTVDIMTTSSELATRDADKMKSFYDFLGITSGHIIRTDGVSEEQRLEIYKADIVYGESMSLIGDTLSDLSRVMKHGRIFDLLIIDEFDSHAIDRRDMKVRNSGLFPGFEHLKPVFGYALGRLNLLTQLSAGNSTTTFVATPNMTHLDQPGTISSINMPYDQFLSESLHTYIRDEVLKLTGHPNERPVVLPKHLNDFGPEHIPAWVKSAITATAEYVEDHHYIVRPRNWLGLTDRQRQASAQALASNQTMNQTATADVNTARVNNALGELPNFSDLFNEHIIVPMDFQNTGEPQRLLQWSDGLHQFLQVAHKVGMTSESLVSSFMSYLGHLRKYGQVYGLTGTLGNDGHRSFLNKTCGVDSLIMPNFVKKRMSVFDAILIEGYQETLDAIVNSTLKYAGQGRATLVITPLIKDLRAIANLIHERIADNPDKADQFRVFEYGEGSSSEAVKGYRKAGDIVVATNLAGRGADIQITAQVEAIGGLHVILAAFQANSRAQIQALGRVARKEQFGSGQMIINIQDEYFWICDYDLECRESMRDDYEAFAMKQASACQVTYLLLADELFDNQIWLIRKAESPTGYEIMIPDGSKSHEHPAEREIRLQVHDDSVSLLITWRSDVLALDITAILKAMNYRTYRQIIRLPKLQGRNLAFMVSGEGLQLLHFLAAYHGFDFEHQAMFRTALAYERLWLGEPVLGSDSLGQALRDIGGILTGGRAKRLTPVTGFHPPEQEYLERLSRESSGSAADNASPAQLTREELELIRLRAMYAQWQADTKIYNKALEVQQTLDYFAIWLKQQEIILQRERSECEASSNDEAMAAAAIHFQTVRAWMLGNFSIFAQDIATRVNEGKMLINPTYLVKQGLDLQTVAFHQSQRVGEHFQLFGTYPFSGKIPKFSSNISAETIAAQSCEGSIDARSPCETPGSTNKETWTSWASGAFSTFTNAAYSAASSAAAQAASAATNLAKTKAASALTAAWSRAASYSNDWLFNEDEQTIRGSALFIRDPLKDAIERGERAVALEDRYNFAAHQMLSYMRVIKDSPAVRKADENGMREAKRINNAFLNDAINANISLFLNYITPRQTHLTHLIINGLTNSTAPLTVSLVLELKVLSEISKMLQDAITIVDAAVRNPKQNQVVRIRRGIGLKEFMTRVNVNADDLSEAQRLAYANSGLPMPEAVPKGGAVWTGGTARSFTGFTLDTLTEPDNSTVNETANSTAASSISNTTNLNFTRTALESASRQPDIYPQSIMQELMINGVVLFEVELFKLAKPNKNWFGTVLAGVLGIAKIALGVALMAGGGPFAAIFGQSLIFGGLGDCVSVINSIRTGQPIPVRAYLQSTAISVAIGLSLAGLGSLGVFGQATAFASKFKTTGEVISGFLPIAFGQTTLVTLATKVIAERMQKIAKSNDAAIEQMIDKKLNEFMRTHANELTVVMASDIWLSMYGSTGGLDGSGNYPGLSPAVQSTASTFAQLPSIPTNSYGDILSEASASARRHSRKYHSPVANYGVGVLAGGIGMAIGGSPMMGLAPAAANVGVNAAWGLAEATTATDSVLDHLDDFISSRESASANSRLMMLAALQQAFPSNAVAIMTALSSTDSTTSAAFASVNSIDYQHCGNLNTTSVLNSFNASRSAIYTICTSIEALYTGSAPFSAPARVESLRLSLRGLLLAQMHGIINTNLVQPLANLMGEFAWKPFAIMQEKHNKKLVQKKLAEKKLAEENAERAEQLRRMQSATEETRAGAEKARKQKTTVVNGGSDGGGNGGHVSVDTPLHSTEDSSSMFDANSNEWIDSDSTNEYANGYDNEQAAKATSARRFSALLDKRRTYITQPGDTIDGTACRHGVTTEDIVRANPHLKYRRYTDSQGRNIIIIHNGDPIVIPGNRPITYRMGWTGVTGVITPQSSQHSSADSTTLASLDPATLTPDEARAIASARSNFENKHKHLHPDLKASHERYLQHRLALHRTTGKPMEFSEFGYIVQNVGETLEPLKNWIESEHPSELATFNKFRNWVNEGLGFVGDKVVGALDNRLTTPTPMDHELLYGYGMSSNPAMLDDMGDVMGTDPNRPRPIREFMSARAAEISEWYGTLTPHQQLVVDTASLVLDVAGFTSLARSIIKGTFIANKIIAQSAAGKAVKGAVNGAVKTEISGLINQFKRLVDEFPNKQFGRVIVGRTAAAVGRTPIASVGRAMTNIRTAVQAECNQIMRTVGEALDDLLPQPALLGMGSANTAARLRNTMVPSPVRRPTGLANTVHEGKLRPVSQATSSGSGGVRNMMSELDPQLPTQNLNVRAKPNINHYRRRIEKAMESELGGIHVKVQMGHIESLHIPCANGDKGAIWKHLVDRRNKHLAETGKLKSFSAFLDYESAKGMEVVVKKHASEIKAWATNNIAGKSKEFVLDLGKPVGYLLDSTSDNLLEVNKILVGIKKSSGNAISILTAFPIV